MIVVAAIFALSLQVTPICVFAEFDSSELSCQKAYRTLINETTSEILTDGSFRTIQGDVFDSDDYVEVNGTKEGCVCHLKTCIRKCCPEGAKFVHRYCNDKFSVLKGLAIPEKIGPSLNNFHLTYGMDCGSSDRLQYMVDARIDGEFYISDEGVLILAKAEFYEFFDYCLDYNEEYQVVTIVCDRDPKKDSSFYWLSSIGLIISAPFLLLSFIVYALLPEKNIYNRLLMCNLMSMMLGNVTLVIIKIIPLTPEHSSCTFIGMLSYFFALVSFFCVNVIAYDIWSTFRNIRAPTISKSKKGKKRTLFYSLYVVGIPLVMAVVVITLTKTSELTAWYNPRMGIRNCWFSDFLGVFTYVYFPLTITVLISIILFASTAWNIRKIKNDTKQLEGKDSQKHEKGKQLFSVYLKLCLVMGVNMAILIIVLMVDILTGGKVPKLITFMAAMTYTFYGIFIFFVFVIKKSIWKQLKKRFNNASDVKIITKASDCNEGNSSTSKVSNNTSITKV